MKNEEEGTYNYLDCHFTHTFNAHDADYWGIERAVVMANIDKFDSEMTIDDIHVCFSFMSKRKLRNVLKELAASDLLNKSMKKKFK